MEQVVYAVLDGSGLITEVNDRRRALASSTGLTLSNAGIGVFYLDYCLDDDQRDAIRAVMHGGSPLTAFIYPCHTHERKRWFVAVVIPEAQARAGVVLLHVDISDWNLESSTATLAGLTPTVAQWPSDTSTVQATLATTWMSALGGTARLPPSSAGRLSPRQLQVLRLIGEGRSNQEIAKDLGCRIQTIKQHVSAILRRLDLSSRTQAALYWRRHIDRNPLGD